MVLEAVQRLLGRSLHDPERRRNKHEREEAGRPGLFCAFPYNDIAGGATGPVRESDYEGREDFDSMFWVLEDISIRYGTTRIPGW